MGPAEHLHTVLDKQRAVCQIRVPCGWSTASISLVDLSLTGHLAAGFTSSWRNRAASARRKIQWATASKAPGSLLGDLNRGIFLGRTDRLRSAKQGLSDPLDEWQFRWWRADAQHVHDRGILPSPFFRGASSNGASILPAIQRRTKATISTDPVKPWIEVMRDVHRNRRVERVLIHGAAHGAAQ